MPQVTRLSRVDPSPPLTCAALTPADPTLTVSQGKTRGRGRTGRCVYVERGSEVSDKLPYEPKTMKKS